LSYPPPPPPLAVTRARAEPIAGRAKVAMIGIGVSMAASALSVAAALTRRRDLGRVKDGQFVSDARLQQLDDRVHAAAVIVLLGIVVGAACFLPWFHRAYKNLKTWHPTRFGTGWAIGGWFVPFLNLVRPYQIAKELASDSGPRPTNPTNALPTWWGLLIVGIVVNRVMFNQNPHTVDDFIKFDLISAISDAIWIAAGAALLVVIRSVTKAQQQTMQESAAASGS